MSTVHFRQDVGRDCLDHHTHIRARPVLGALDGPASTVAVFAAGPGHRVEVVLPAGSVIVGVDAGVEVARRLGYEIDLAVGDFDSLSPAMLVELERSGTPIERHPATKDASDLELGLEAALRFEPDRIVVIGGDAGR